MNDTEILEAIADELRVPREMRPLVSSGGKFVGMTACWDGCWQPSLCDGYLLLTGPHGYFGEFELADPDCFDQLREFLRQGAA